MSCTRTCHRPSPNQAHCPSCHRTFGGGTGFDSHRRQGRCMDPEDLGMVADWKGVWRKPMPESARMRFIAPPPVEQGGPNDG